MLTPLLLCLVLQDSPFPVRTDIPDPPPVVPPETDTPSQFIDEITYEEFYVIESEDPLLVLASPQGVVSVTYEQGPLMARGKWSGSNGDIETRMLLGKHLYFVDVITSGSVEMLVIKSGATDPDSIFRQKISTQRGPRPPPDTEPDDDPDEDKIIVPDTGEFRVLMVYDEDADLDALNAINSISTRKWLDQNTDGWRAWDRSSIDEPGYLDNEEEVWKGIWKSAGPSIPDGPHLLIIKGKTITVRPLTSQVVQELESVK